MPDSISHILDDRMVLILLNVRDRMTMQQMCGTIGRSMGIIQRHLSYLERHGYVDKPMGPSGKKGKTRGRKLTKIGEKYLKQMNHATSQRS